LQHHDLLVTREARIEEHLRDLRGLARTGGGDEDETIVFAKMSDDVGVDFPDGQRGVRHAT
jgi:hypothetical protein